MFARTLELTGTSTEEFGSFCGLGAHFIERIGDGAGGPHEAEDNDERGNDVGHESSSRARAGSISLTFLNQGVSA